MKRIMGSLLAIASVLFAETSVAANAEFSDEQICRAGIATSDARDPKIIGVKAAQKDYMTLTYTRSDGKVVEYDCRVDGVEIRWRDKTMPDWNKMLRIFFTTAAGHRLQIVMWYGQKKVDSRLFGPEDLSNASDGGAEGPNE